MGSAERRGFVTVRSAFHGNVEEKEEVKRDRGRKDRERAAHRPSGVCGECLCTVCECVSYWYEVMMWLYSHSVVPGGLEVRSYITLEMPGIFLISFTIFSTTWWSDQNQVASWEGFVFVWGFCHHQFFWLGKKNVFAPIVWHGLPSYSQVLVSWVQLVKSQWSTVTI